MFVIIVNGLLYAITIYKKTCGRKKVRSNQKIDKWGQIMGSVGLFVLLGKYPTSFSGTGHIVADGIINRPAGVLKISHWKFWGRFVYYNDIINCVRQPIAFAIYLYMYIKC